MRNAAKLGILAACAFLVPAVHAESVDATNPQQLVSIIQQLGYRATLEADGVGDPMIKSSVNGTDFAIYFYGCTYNEACKSLLFKVGYDLANGIALAEIEDWNEGTLFGRAYLDDEADPWLEMPVNMDGGVSRHNFEDNYDWWDVIVNGFEDHIGF